MTAATTEDTATTLYGCMGLGGDWGAASYTPADIDRAEAAIEAALDAGIGWFDHADIYAGGKAESVFGEVLSRTPGLRERVRIQTKCGIRLADGDRPGRYDLRRDTIVRRVRESLERLRVESLDVLLLHRPDPLAEPAEVAEALAALHDEGLVRQVGVSNMSDRQIDRLRAYLDLPVVANQLEMSLARRDWLEAGVLVNTDEATRNGFPLGTVEYCGQHSIALQAWGSLAQGRFSGRGQTAAELATSELVASLAAEKDATPESVVLWWLRHHPARIAPVIGTTSPERIRACRDAVGVRSRLTDDEWYALWVAARGEPLP